MNGNLRQYFALTQILVIEKKRLELMLRGHARLQAFSTSRLFIVFIVALVCTAVWNVVLFADSGS